MKTDIRYQRPGKSSVLLNCWPKVNDLYPQVFSANELQSTFAQSSATILDIYVWEKGTILSVPFIWKRLIKPICWQENLHSVFQKWDRPPNFLKCILHVKSCLHCHISKILWTFTLDNFYLLGTIWYIWWQSLPFDDDVFIFNVVVGYPLFVHIFHCFYHLNIMYNVFLLLCI